MSAIKQAENIFAALRKMADKSHFGPELSEAKIEAPVEELLILEFLIKLPYVPYSLSVTSYPAHPCRIIALLKTPGSTTLSC